MLKKIINAVAAAFLLFSVALPALAETSSAIPATTGDKNSVDLACMQSAVDKRDSSILAAVDSYSAAVKAALTARKDALKSAWSLTDRKARRQALRDAWSAYAKAARNARKDFKSAKHTAWTQFNKDRKVCGRGAADDPGAEGHDSAL